MNDTAFREFSAAEKKITAATLVKTNADVIGVQEIEGLETLRTFQSQMIAKADRWAHAMSVDARDP